MKKQKAFTLIELLLVLFFSAIIVCIVLGSFSGVLAKNRNVKRKSDISTIIQFLELYYLKYGNYPEINDWISLEQDTDTNRIFSQAMEKFLPIMPRDPLSLYGKTNDEGEPYSYQYMSSKDGEHWAIKVLYETEGAGGIGEIVIVYSSWEGEMVMLGKSPEEILAEAMDYPELLNLNFSTGGDFAWGVDETTGLGGISAKSGAISDNQISYWEISPDEGGKLSLDYIISSESGDYLKLSVMIGESAIQSMDSSGEGSGTFSSDLYPGYALKVEYIKDGSGSSGQDCAWTDNVSWIPD